MSAAGCPFRRIRALIMLAIALSVVPPIAAQETPPAAEIQVEPAASADAATTAGAEAVRLPSSEAEDFLGDWILKVTTFRGDNYVDFKASDEEGFVLATFTLPPPMTVDPIRNITRDGDRFSMKFILNFGSSVIDMTMQLHPEDGRYIGTLVDANNMFNSQVALLTVEQADAEKAAAAAAAAAAPDGDGDGGDSAAEANRETTKLVFGDREVSIQFSQTKPEGADYERLESLPAGGIVTYTTDFATKLSTGVSLMFGDALVATENVAKDYPGVYSLWLERTAEGWALRFNHRPDIWGTQHNPEADGPAVPLTHEHREETAGTLRYVLEQNGEAGGTLRIEWGAHVWTTPFALAP